MLPDQRVVPRVQARENPEFREVRVVDPRPLDELELPRDVALEGLEQEADLAGDGRTNPIRNPAPHDSGWRRYFNGWNFGSLQWQTAAAALLLVALSGSAIWFALHRDPRAIPQDQALFNNSTVKEVERAEAAYERAIDKLDAKARPQLENAATPLMANYREKLVVLDSAIADLKSQAGINPANGHLRRQLLAMYQEKQDTLEQVLEAKQ